MPTSRCEDCGHFHRSGYCIEVCRRCQLEELLDAGFDADELGLDPEEEYDA